MFVWSWGVFFVEARLVFTYLNKRLQLGVVFAFLVSSRDRVNSYY